MDVFPKFIIEDGNLILSKCKLHKDLATDPEAVIGGGWWRFDGTTFIFGGESHDFGRAPFEDVKKAVEEDKVYTNPLLTHSIANKYNFSYDIGSEIIKIK